MTFQGRLTDVQQRAFEALRPHDNGVLVAPPGVGKTVVGIRLIAERARNTLVLVHRKPLLDQWRAQLSLFLGIPEKSIGRIGAGQARANGRLDVAMIQSLVRGGAVSDVIAGYGHVVIDECHHVSAVSFERVLSEVKARYVTGLTATPHRRDGHDPIITMQCGPVRFQVSARDPAARPAFLRQVVVRDTAFRLLADAAAPGIQALYGVLAQDQRRNDAIVEDVRTALGQRRSPLLLTERRDHLETLSVRCREFAPDLVTLHGGLSVRERRAELARLAQLAEGSPRLILATGRFAGEGFDDPRLDTLFLALPISWRGILVQYAGRLHRAHDGKTDVRIYDYVDRSVPVLARMFERRSRGYRVIGYAPIETAVAPDDLVLAPA